MNGINVLTKSQKLAGRVALITGASRGIGRSVAKKFAKEGAQIILVATTTGGLEELDDEIRSTTGKKAVLVPLDINDAAGIERLANHVFERHKKLDILVGNAAVLGDLTPMAHLSPKVWDNVIKTNLTANWNLLRNFDPLLQLSDAGRAIFVTSSLGSIPRPYWSAYAVSKAGLEMMIKIYASEQIMDKVKANLINPGATRTRMRAKAIPGEDPKKVKSPDMVADAFVYLAQPICRLNGSLIDSKGNEI